LPAYFYGRSGLLIVIGSILSIWIILSSFVSIKNGLLSNNRKSGINRSVLGMAIAHLGLGLFVLGVTFVSSFGIETDRSFSVGDTLSVAGYDYRLKSIKNAPGPNYQAIEAEIDVYKDNLLYTKLYPQKRTYIVQKSPMTEAAIMASWNKDLFIALGDSLGGDKWSVRIQYKPMIRWIWFGCLIMALGGAIAISDKRYRSIA
jgi:cytochrome c-type biogenesis protein CcmF